MINFEYTTLPKEIKQLATVFWIWHLFERTKTKNPNQLIEYFKNTKQGRIHFTREKQNNFFQKKWSGQTMQKDNNLNIIEEILQGSSGILFHPIWRLLDIRRESKSNLRLLKPSFSQKLQEEIFDDSASFDSRELIMLSYKNNIDGLTGLLWLQQYNKLRKVVSNAELIELLVLQLALRLITFCYPNISSKFKYFFYSKIRALFKKKNNSKPIIRITLTNFPNTLHQISKQSLLKDACYIYQSLADRLILTDNIFQQDQQTPLGHTKAKYLTTLDHLTLKNLSKDLNKTKGITPNERNSDLGQLREYFHLRLTGNSSIELFMKFYTFNELTSNGLINQTDYMSKITNNFFTSFYPSK